MINSTLKGVAAVFTITVLLISVGAASANASSSAIYQTCKVAGSMNGFSKSDLQGALGGVPADLDEYYSCSAQINAALVDKATRNLPGGKGKGVKGTRARLRLASVDDLTTPAERQKVRDQVARSTKLDTSKPLTANSDPAISEAAGQTLASTTAPSTPTALIIGIFGLLLLLGAELTGRLGKLRGAEKILPWSKRRDDG